MKTYLIDLRSDSRQIELEMRGHYSTASRPLMDKKKTALVPDAPGQRRFAFVASLDDKFGCQQIQCEIGIDRNLA